MKEGHLHRLFLPMAFALGITGSLVAPGGALGQDNRPSFTGNAAAEAAHNQLPSQPYTFKTGDFRLLVTPALGLDYNDNINISAGDRLDDVILKPNIDFLATYPITAHNLLRVNVGVGYDQYFNHDEYSGFRLRSGSDVTFLAYVKDFRINIHDRFSYTQDAAGTAALAGTSRYGQFQNTSGVSVDWDLQDVTLTLGYDHNNRFSTTGGQQYTDSAAEVISSRAAFQAHPRVQTGIEGNVSFTRYDQPVLNDNTGYSGGAFADWKPGNFSKLTVRGGYNYYAFDQTSLTIPAEDQSGWYAGVNFSHEITRSVSYSIDVGHDLSLGLQADTTEKTWFRPSVSWKIIKDLSLSTYFSYETGEQSRGGVLGAGGEEYDWYGTGVGLSYPLMKKLSVALNYRYTFRSSNTSGLREYDQNVVGLLLTYRPQ